MNRKQIVLSIVALAALGISGCSQQFNPNESAFLQRCPEVNLGRIAPADREVFMATYEELRPRLDGNDVCMLSTKEEIATIKGYEIEVIREDVQLPDGSTLTPIRIKGAGAGMHKQIVRNFSQGFVSSFLAARK